MCSKMKRSPFSMYSQLADVRAREKEILQLTRTLNVRDKQTFF